MIHVVGDEFALAIPKINCIISGFQKSHVKLSEHDIVVSSRAGRDVDHHLHVSLLNQRTW